MRLASAFALLVLAAALYVATDPLQIGPIAKFPQFSANYVEQPTTAAEIEAAKLQGDLKNRLALSEQRFVNQICGPESIAFDSQGRGPYTGLCDGRIVRWEGSDRGWADFALTSSNRSICIFQNTPNLANEHICGRPLGLRFNKRTSELYIADAYKGLLVVGPAGGLAKTLLTEVEGELLHFTNDLDFDEQGVVYFTDSSTKYQRRNFILPILEGDNTGRLLKYDPATKQASVVLRGLRFPNGVSMSKDFSFLVFAESITGKLTRFWLKGPKAGSAEIFAVLPGHPDNIRTNEQGDFWVAMYCLRTPLMKFLGSRPWLRELLLRAPVPRKFIFKAISGRPSAIVLKYDADGKLLDTLEDQRGEVAKTVSEAEEHDGHLWLGSVLYNHIAVYKL